MGEEQERASCVAPEWELFVSAGTQPPPVTPWVSEPDKVIIMYSSAA